MPASSPAALALARGEGARTGHLPFWIPVLAGLCHAILTGVAFPPVGLWPAVFFIPIPLIWIALLDSRRAAPAAAPAPKRRRIARSLRTPLLVSLGVLPVHIYEHQWVMDVSTLGYFPMVVIMAGFAGAFVWLLARGLRRFPRLPLALAAALVWTGVEVFRGEVIVTGYPWLLLAHPLIDAPLLPAAASVLGAYFVSFLAAAVAGLIVEAATVRPIRPVSLTATLAVVLAGFFALPLLGPSPRPAEGSIRIAVVQTNIPQDNKLDWTLEQRFADFTRFLELTREAASATPGPELIVWPETMFPGAFLEPAGIQAVRDAELRLRASLPGLRVFAEELLELQSELGIPMLVGALGYDNPRLTGPAERLRLDFDHRYNSVFLLRGGRVEPTRYDKIALTPFGEVMPYVNLWPWLQNRILAIAAHGMAFDLTPGAGPRTFRIPSNLPDRPEIAVATPICFEATKPGLCRLLLRGLGDDPRILINLTNDGWFGDFDPTRLQHLQIARWRAVELATPVVRAANTGISTWIDSRGRVIKQGVEDHPSGIRTDGVLIADVHPGRGDTIYLRVGDVFGWSAMGLTIALGVASFLKPRRGHPAAGGTQSTAA